jgi:hypothetical protein
MGPHPWIQLTTGHIYIYFFLNAIKIAYVDLAQWLSSVIPATWEAKMGRITV